MNLVVTTEFRFDSTADGQIWTRTAFPRSFWDRYLETFETVRVVARLGVAEDFSAEWRRVDGDRVCFSALPNYVGAWQFLIRSREVISILKRNIAGTGALIMRVPSHLADILTSVVGIGSRPYGIEVVGDPYDVFAPGSVRHPLRPFFRWLFSRSLRRQCANACAAAYVTGKTLQRRYPPSPQAFTTHYSDIELPESCVAKWPRVFDLSRRQRTLINVGTMAQMYKGQDVLIDAVGICVREGLDLKLALLGDGKHRIELQSRAAAAGLDDRVQFLGLLPAGEPVRAQLDNADVFVLPSHTEGLPRAMIEAMARGLPCIGSAVGGIPELLPQEDLVPPKDARSLATKISDVVRDPWRMTKMSERNLGKSKQYGEEILKPRRLAFHRYVKRMTEEWKGSGAVG
jgi:glycosyltransferase involved in cell wall biosynthesis